MTKCLDEVQTETGKIDQCATFLELNEEVDVATDCRFTPSIRAEDARTHNPALRQRSSDLLVNLFDRDTSNHYVIVAE